MQASTADKLAAALRTWLSECVRVALQKLRLEGGCVLIGSCVRACGCAVVLGCCRRASGEVGATRGVAPPQPSACRKAGAHTRACDRFLRTGSTHLGCHPTRGGLQVACKNAPRGRSTQRLGKHLFMRLNATNEDYCLAVLACMRVLEAKRQSERVNAPTRTCLEARKG